VSLVVRYSASARDDLKRLYEYLLDLQLPSKTSSWPSAHW